MHNMMERDNLLPTCGLGGGGGYHVGQKPVTLHPQPTTPRPTLELLLS